MQLVFAVTVEARADLVRLLEPRVTDPFDALLRAENILDDTELVVLAHGGPPSGAVHRRRPSGHRWYWKYVDGIWLAFTVEQVRWVALFRRQRRVTVVAAEALLPPV